MAKICPLMLVGLTGPTIQATLNPLQKRCVEGECELWTQSSLTGGRSGCSLRIAAEGLVCIAKAAE